MSRLFWVACSVSLFSCNGALIFDTPSAEICNDLVDNDGNGAIDCQDSACSQSCVEVCGDALDNDQDGNVDCLLPWRCGQPKLRPGADASASFHQRVRRYIRQRVWRAVSVTLHGDS